MKLQLKSCEISLTDHCILKCAGFSHASPHLRARFTPPESIFADLQALAQVAQADELRVAGGEPLAHSQLLDILAAARKTAVASQITLITNGVLLHRAPLGLWQAIDHLRVSAYPGTKLGLTREEIHALAACHGISVTIDEIATFSRIFLNHKTAGPIARFIYQNCWIAHRGQCNLVHEGRFYKCPEAGFMAARLARLGISLDNKGQDGIALHDKPALQPSLQDYLNNRHKPLRACSYCLGTIGKSFPSQQLTNDGLNRELIQSDRFLLPLVSPKKILYSYLQTHPSTHRAAKAIKRLINF